LLLCFIAGDRLDFATFAVFLRQEKRGSTDGTLQYVRLNFQVVPNLFRSDDERLRLLQDFPVIVVPVAQAFSNASISSSTVRERR
jgi:hypothetical protein